MLFTVLLADEKCLVYLASALQVTLSLQNPMKNTQKNHPKVPKSAIETKTHLFTIMEK